MKSLIFYISFIFREMEVFPKFHSVPFSKILTFFRKSPFVFAASLNRFKKAYTAYNSGVAAYDHWTPEEAKKLELAIAEKVSWLDANISRVKATLKTKDLPIKAAAFHSEHQVNYPTLPTSSRLILRSR